LFPRLDVPAGYERRDIYATTLIARQDIVDSLATAIRERQELIAFARDFPGARPMQGRQMAYAIPIGGTHGVVRRNHHGGVFRRWTGSMFLWPRAQKELAISLSLQRMGIPTPTVLAIAIYRVDLLFVSDVVTEEILQGQDFGAFLLESRLDTEDRRHGWRAVFELLDRLAAAGVRHHDLNVKNILLRRASGDSFAAYVLDVDRVVMNLSRRDADAGNRARLLRSLEKWRDTRQLQISDAEIETLRRTAPSIP
jgi:hypothetical protein